MQNCPEEPHGQHKRKELWHNDDTLAALLTPPAA
jgi:hypothetical protein